MNNLKQHIPSLDGVRGLAILSVLVAHFYGEAIVKESFPLIGPFITKILMSGLYGVNLFFVLSGFLITNILIDSKGSKRFFLNFYARRFLRIFPLYYGALILVFGVLPHFVQLDATANELSRHQWWLWAYLSNVPGNPDWDSSNLFWLGHFWSLAVEEHFYLVWPFVVASFQLERLKMIMVAMVVASATIGMLPLLGFSGRVFDLLGWTTLTHCGGLAVGAFVAASGREIGAFEALAKIAEKWIVLLGVLFGLLALLPRTSYPNAASILVPVSWLFFGAVLVKVLVAEKNSRVAMIFSSTVLVSFGKYSYGLYVYHGIFRPIFEELFPRQTLNGILQSPLLGIFAYYLLAIGTSFLLAFVSWHVYEVQWLKLKRRFEYGKA